MGVENCWSTACGAVSSWCVRVNERMPHFASLGLAFWIAWFGVAYATPSWVGLSTGDLSPIREMFSVSTVSHVTGLLALALLARRFSGFTSSRLLTAVSAVIASLGCAMIAWSALSGFLGVPFYFGAVCSGLGTSVLCVGGGAVLCAMRPGRALRTILSCELVAACVQLMVFGLPTAITQAAFIGLPLVSALCLVVGSFARHYSVTDEPSRLSVPGSYVRFLAVAFALSVAANMSRGLYSSIASASDLGYDGVLIKLAVALCLAVAILAFAGAHRPPNFTRWFYPLSASIIVVLLVVYLFPAEFSFGLVASSVAFKLFDVLMWYAFAYIAYQSKVSAASVVAFGRTAICLGAAGGNILGGLCMSTGTLQPASSTILFIVLFAALLVTFLAFPEGQALKLIAPIPDEDFGLSEDEAVVLGDATSATATATGGSSENDSARDNEMGRIAYIAERFGLTERETEVFELLARGRGSQSVSAALSISVYTARAHTRNIYTKLDVHSRQELMALVDEEIGL